MTAFDYAQSNNKLKGANIFHQLDRILEETGK